MTTVFVSGSRTINRLNMETRNRLKNVVDKQFSILVGDANGADKAFQKYLAEMRYPNVVVFCSGDRCRNNLGNWNVKNIAAESKLKGRDFYTQKDKVMAAEADYGLVLWDGKSPGSFNNIMELVKNRKKALVYFTPDKKFYTLSGLDDAQNLLNRCDRDSLAGIQKRLKLQTKVQDQGSRTQGPMLF